jgi:hypothetical protein
MQSTLKSEEMHVAIIVDRYGRGRGSAIAK